MGINKNNQVVLAGLLVSGFELSHEIYGEKFYLAHVLTHRFMGNVDILPVMVSDRAIDVSDDWEGKFVQVVGQIHSYNKTFGGKKKLIVFIFAEEFEFWHMDDDTGYQPDKNMVFLEGWICKQPIYRTTPNGREIADLLVAVNRSYGKSDYIPCIVWGRNARFAGKLTVGTRISLEGRMQSREYQKRISDEEFETKTVYEMSASRISVIAETEDEEHAE